MANMEYTKIQKLKKAFLLNINCELRKHFDMLGILGSLHGELEKM